jgi:hypothetical protein
MTLFVSINIPGFTGIRIDGVNTTGNSDVRDNALVNQNSSATGYGIYVDHTTTVSTNNVDLVLNNFTKFIADLYITSTAMLKTQNDAGLNYDPHNSFSTSSLKNINNFNSGSTVTYFVKSGTTAPTTSGLTSLPVTANIEVSYTTQPCDIYGALSGWTKYLFPVFVGDSVSNTTVTKNTIDLYPNPTQGQINFLYTIADEKASWQSELKLVDNMGREVWTKQFGGKQGSYSIDLPQSLSPGIYHAIFFIENSQPLYRNIMITR